MESSEPNVELAPIEATLVEPSSTDVPTPAVLLAIPRWLHPSSIVFGLLASIRQFLIAGLVAFFLAGSANRFALLGAFVVVCFAAMGAILQYVTLRYSLVNGELRIDEGLIFRRHRVIPAVRIQNIDLLQNPVHHLLRVAEVRIETAGGSEPEARLRVLALSDVDTLRDAVFANRTEIKATQQALSPVQEAADTILSISLRQILLAGLVSNRGYIFIPLLFGAFYEFNLYERLDLGRLFKSLPQDLTTGQTVAFWSVIALAVILIMRIFSMGWFVLRFYNYRLQRVGADLRVSCGLFTRVSATVPRRRIQFISVQQSLLGRWCGIATVRIETAGSAAKENEDAAQTVARRWFIPVMWESETQRVLTALAPQLDYQPASLEWVPTSPRTASRLTRLAILQALLASAVGFAVVRPWGAMLGVALLPIFIYFAWRYAKSLKFARTSCWMVYRSGLLIRKTSFTFFDKVQGVSVSQSPFDRRWAMATLLVDTAGAGPADHKIEVCYLPESIANQQLTDIAKSAAKTRLSPA